MQRLTTGAADESIGPQIARMTICEVGMSDKLGKGRTQPVRNMLRPAGALDRVLILIVPDAERDRAATLDALGGFGCAFPTPEGLSFPALRFIGKASRRLVPPLAPRVPHERPSKLP